MWRDTFCPEVLAQERGGWRVLGCGTGLTDGIVLAAGPLQASAELPGSPGVDAPKLSATTCPQSGPEPATILLN